MNGSLPRKGVVGTLFDAAGWLRRTPFLIAVYFLYGLLELFAELLGPIGGLLSLVGILVVLYLDGLVHVIGKQEAAGGPTDVGRASSAVLGRFLSLIGILIVYALMIIVGFFLLILPGIYLAVRLSLAFPACVIDDRDAFESLETSWSVAKGNLLKLFGITVVSLLIAGSAAFATVLFTGVGEEFYLTYTAVTAVLTAVISPIVQFAYARVYLENRPADAASRETSGARRSGETGSWGTATDDRTDRGTDGWGDDSREESSWGDESRDDRQW